MPVRYLITREVGELLGVSYQRVQQIVKDYADFPEPMIVGKRTKMYPQPEVERWMAKHPDRGPGTRIKPKAGQPARPAPKRRPII